MRILKSLSHPSWCTKSFAAAPYLKQGDFHVYLENGKSKLGLRFEGDKMIEIQGPNNDSRIPFESLDALREHIEKENLDASAFEEEMLETEIRKEELDEFKKAFEAKYGKKFEDSHFEILNCFGFFIEKIQPVLGLTKRKNAFGRDILSQRR